MRKCIFILPDIGTGGAETALLRLARMFSQFHHVVIAVMSPQSDYSLGEASCVEMTQNVKVLFLDTYTKPGERYQSLRIIYKVFRWFIMARNLKKLKEGSDVYISFLPGAHLLNVMSGSSQKIVISQRGSRLYDVDLTGFKRFIWLNVLDPFIYKHASRIVSASKGIHQEISSKFPQFKHKALYIEGLIDLDNILRLGQSPADSDLIYLEGFDTVVAIGRLHVSKGFDFLIDVVCAAWAQNSHIRLLIIGDGPELNNLWSQWQAIRDYMRSDGHDVPYNLVTFAGYRTAPYRMIKVGKLFALPSRNEGLPNALLEAIAVGCRVIAADCPWGVRSILSRNESDSSIRRVGSTLECVYGKLLPPPNEDGARECWITNILTEVLTVSGRSGPSRERLKDLRRYDTTHSGQAWLTLISELS